MKAWYTAAELAGLPGLPGTARRVTGRARRESWARRPRSGRGGGWEYAAGSLPRETQSHLTLPGRERIDAQAHPTEGAATEAGQPILDATRRTERWAAFERLPGKARQEAARRADACDLVERLTGTGMGRVAAVEAAAQSSGDHPATLRRWLRLVRGLPRDEWLPALAPRHGGGRRAATCSPEAWDFFRADYLRLEAPGAAACYQRLLRTAQAHGWSVPSLPTLTRRLEREVPKGALVLAREGREALARLYPAQRRDRSVFHALQAVNADGHRFDVFCRWPDGTVGRPLMVAWQDLYSGKLLAWRIDRTESAELVRLSCGDLVERFGIPEHAYLDNGRGFASKWLTGRMAWRHRFKITDHEPSGVLTTLGVAVHWTTPYHGQAKPIERAFRDLCESIAKHPACAGAYTGNRPDAKPENHGSRAVPIEDFERLAASEIHAHNARPGRRAAVCGGRSFDQTFTESYRQAPIRKATAVQRRLWLLAGEGVYARKPGGQVELLGNAYWSEALTRHAGTRLVVRFDPQRLHEPVHAYTLDGRYIGPAECIQQAGFNDLDAARTHAKARADFRKANKAARDAARRMEAADVAALLPDGAPPEPEAANVIRPDFGRMPEAERLPLRDGAQTAADGDGADAEAAFSRAVGMMERSFWEES